MAIDMYPSSTCIELIKTYEGFRPTAYKCPAGVWTVGYGRTKGVTPTTVCTMAEATAWLAEDLAAASKAVLRHVKVPLTQNQFDALVSLVFNIGEGNFKNSTLLDLLNGKNYVLAAMQFDRWVHANKRRQPGLVKRRAAERKLFETKS